MLLDFAESLAREVEVEVVSIRHDLLAMYSKRGYKQISTLPITTRYGNTGCGVFKGGIKDLKGFWLKSNIPNRNY